MGEKAKKAFFYIIIGILLMLIGGVAVAMYFYIKSEDDTIDYEFSSENFTTVVKTTTSTEETSTESPTTETTSVTSDTTGTTSGTTTGTTNTTKSTKSTKSQSTKKSSSYSSSTEWSTSWSSSYSTSWTMSSLTIPPSTTTTRETVFTNSNYPGADSNWEWEILDYVNNIRRSRGLKDLGIVEEFRNLAEKAADKWDGYENPPYTVANIVGNHSWYIAMSNGYSIKSDEFARKLINATAVEESDRIYYLGIGVIRTSSGMLKFVAVYE